MPQYKFDYVISTRRIKGGAFDNEPGRGQDRVHYLRVPTTAKAYVPEHAVKKTSEWIAEVRGLADGDENPLSISPTGDVLVFVHGYSNTPAVILQRLRQLRADLGAEGWRGAVIAFDWPSADETLNYLEDRSDAADVAGLLVENGIRLIAAGQKDGCETNVHLLGHSTGAYVIMEAFVQADKRGALFKSDWRIGQVAFIGGDVASSSLGGADAWAAPMFRRVMRLTNYSSGHDGVLAASNAKRLGVAPRAGRVGLPADAHPKVVNVDCTKYFAELDPKTQPVRIGTWMHSWHIGNRVFARDLAMTMEGVIDRQALTTRALIDGKLHLQDRPRPKFMASWGIEEATAVRAGDT